jgi:hypothetical protein
MDATGEVRGRVVESVTEEAIEVSPAMVLRMVPESVPGVSEVINYPHEVSMCAGGR